MPCFFESGTKICRTPTLPHNKVMVLAFVIKETSGFPLVGDPNGPMSSAFKLFSLKHAAVAFSTFSQMSAPSFDPTRRKNLTELCGGFPTTFNVGSTAKRWFLWCLGQWPLNLLIKHSS